MTTTTKSPPRIKRTWWKESSVYQIYPASFRSTSPTSAGPATGTLRGITAQIDYLAQLGVDVVWLSPILRSPQVDMGYDISDYYDIDPRYGTMADHDALIGGLHERGMRYVMDLVVNHTSVEHEWFRRSRDGGKGKGNEWRDWYIWRPGRVGKDGVMGPPNNWESYFSGSAWTYHPPSDEYYLHLFAPEQPDLNWEHPPVCAAVHRILRFWLARGVDGFRMDVINFISKEPGLPDGPVVAGKEGDGSLQSGIRWHSCGPRLHEWLKGLGGILAEFDAFSVGEMPGVTDAREIVKGVGQERGELGMAFQFEIVDMDHAPSSKFLPRPFRPSTLRAITNKWQTFMLQNSGWNALYLENHDQGRSVSRYASDAPHHRTLSAKMLATFLALQSGTPFVYQGQELAMCNVPLERAGEPEKWYRDIECLNHWKGIKDANPHPETDPQHRRRRDEALYQYRLLGRDNARTPMQWNADPPNAGFTPEGFRAGDGDEEAWMAVHPDFREWNAERAVADRGSAYWFWRGLLDLRKREKDVFVYGGFEMLGLDRGREGAEESEEDKVIAYMRMAEEEEEKEGDAEKKAGKALVVTSFSGQDVLWRAGSEVAERILREGKMVMHSYPEGPAVEKGEVGLRLRPYEAAVWMV